MIFQSKALAFLVFFTFGVLLVPLQLVLEAASLEFALLLDAAKLLTAPGSFITLPLHNFIPGGGTGVIAVVGCVNGALYGFIASVFAKRQPPKRRKRSGRPF